MGVGVGTAVDSKQMGTQYDGEIKGRKGKDYGNPTSKILPSPTTRVAPSRSGRTISDAIRNIELPFSAVFRWYERVVRVALVVVRPLCSQSRATAVYTD